MKLYFAGKIRQNCWRHAIVKGLRSANYENPFDWAPLPINDFHAKHTYAGPFFSSCDHGCSHGPATHGMEESGCSGVTVDNWEKRVVGECFVSILKADEVFVWIDSLDCFATLIEIGFAFRSNKRIRVGVDEKLDLAGSDKRNELWFLQTMATSFGRFDSARSAYVSFYSRERV